MSTPLPPVESAATDNPYAPPVLTPEPSAPALVLTSKAREHDGVLSKSKWTLIAVGLISVAINMYRLFNVPAEVAQAMASQDPDVINSAPVETIMLVFAYTIYGGFLAVGLVFIGLAFLVSRFPRFATLTALVLYLGVNMFAVLLDPAAIMSGIILKIIVAMVLFHGVRSAFAYHKELQAAAWEAELQA